MAFQQVQKNVKAHRDADRAKKWGLEENSTPLPSSYLLMFLRGGGCLENETHRERVVFFFVLFDFLFYKNLNL